MAKAAKTTHKATDAAKPVEEPQNLNQPQSQGELLNLRWGRHTFSSSDEIREAISEFANCSKFEYLSAPKSLPLSLQRALAAVATQDVSSLSKEEAEERGYILKRLGHFLQNQVTHIIDDDGQSAELWSRARQIMKQAQYESATHSFSNTTFSKNSIGLLFQIANAAAEKQQLNKHLLITTPSARGKSKLTPEDRVQDFAKKHSLTIPQKKAYKASILQEEIKIGKPARAAGIKECSQKDGFIRYQGKKTIHVSPQAYAAWIVIRLLVESPSAEVRLFDGWWGAFSKIGYTDFIELLGEKGRKPGGKAPEYLCRLKKFG